MSPDPEQRPPASPPRPRFSAWLLDEVTRAVLEWTWKHHPERFGDVKTEAEFQELLRQLGYVR